MTGDNIFSNKNSHNIQQSNDIINCEQAKLSLKRDDLLAFIPDAIKKCRASKDIVTSRRENNICGYTRYSTVNQTELSTSRQIDDIKKYASLHGLTVVDGGIFSDEGRSGFYITQRDQLAALLERVKQHDVRAVVISDPSRLSRDMVDLGTLYRQLKRLGVELHSASCGKMDQAKIAMFGFLNEAQIETLVHNTRYARRAMVKDNRVPWGDRVIGYERDGVIGGNLKIKEEEADIVRKIFNLAAAGVSHARIAAVLNTGAKLARRKGPWTADAVGRIIRNLLYRGLIVYGRFTWKRNPDTMSYEKKPNPTKDWEISYADHLVIIPDDLWDRAQPAPSERKSAAAHSKQRGQYLLSGLVYCPTCMKHMVCMGGSPGTVARRFICSNHIYNKSCDNGRSWDMGWIETATIRLLATVLDQAPLYGAYLQSLAAEANKASLDIANERDRLKRQLIEEQRELDGTFDATRTRGFSQNSIERIRYAKENSIRNTEDALARLPSPRAAIDVERRIEELGDLASALQGIATTGAIDLTTDEGVQLAAALRGLISRVIPTPKKNSHGVDITLTLAEMALYDPKAAGSEETLKVIEGSYVPPSKEEQRLAKGRAEVERHLASGDCALDEDAWRAIRNLLPKGATSGLDGERRDGRALVDAILLASRLRRPIGDLPPEFGGREPLRSAIRSLVRTGTWSRIVDTLGQVAPRLIAGVDTERFDYCKKKAAKRMPGGAPSRKRRSVVIALLGRTEGASLAEVRAATGQTSSAARTTVSRIASLGLCVTRIKRPDGTRAWYIAAESDLT